MSKRADKDMKAYVFTVPGWGTSSQLAPWSGKRSSPRSGKDLSMFCNKGKAGSSFSFQARRPALDLRFRKKTLGLPKNLPASGFVRSISQFRFS